MVQSDLGNGGAGVFDRWMYMKCLSGSSVPWLSGETRCWGLNEGEMKVVLEMEIGTR